MNDENEKFYEGIFLVDEESLRKLDVIMLRTLEQMKQRIPTEKSTQYGFPSPKYEVVVSDNDSSLYLVNKTYESFQEVIKAEKYNNSVPRQFRVTVSVGNLKQVVELRHGVSECGIRIQTSNPDEIEWIDVVAWAESLVQPWYIRAWAKHWFWLLAIGWMGFFVYISMVARISTQIHERALVGQSVELLNAGITEANRDKAIETILRYHSGIPLVPIPKETISPSPLVILVFVAIVIVALFRPKSVIGIGRGKKAISIQKGWWNIVVKLVTLGVVSSPFVNIIKTFLTGNS